MEPIKCIFGKHEYKLKDMHVHFIGECLGRYYYMSEVKCCHCGHIKEVSFDTENPLKKRKNDESVPM